MFLPTARAGAGKSGEKAEEVAKGCQRWPGGARSGSGGEGGRRWTEQVVKVSEGVQTTPTFENLVKLSDEIIDSIVDCLGIEKLFEF